MLNGKKLSANVYEAKSKALQTGAAHDKPFKFVTSLNPSFPGTKKEFYSYEIILKPRTEVQQFQKYDVVF